MPLGAGSELDDVMHKTGEKHVSINSRLALRTLKLLAYERLDLTKGMYIY